MKRILLFLASVSVCTHTYGADQSEAFGDSFKMKNSSQPAPLTFDFASPAIGRHPGAPLADCSNP
jgi:hypothetical protein